MAGQVSPGIVLKERDATTQTIVNAQANTAALVGNFEKGPVGTITSISNEKELVTIFGKPNNNNYEDWFSAATFLDYGGQLQIVRVADTSLKNAITDAGSTTTDATKLYVAASASFAATDMVKVDNEYFLVSAITNTAGEKSLTVTRAQLGSTAVQHANAATVTKWTYANSATTTVVNETIDATETIIDLTLSTGFTVGSYFRMTNSGAGANAANEIVLITAVEGNTVIVSRGQLGTTAAAQPGAVITATLLTFAATATTTTLSEVYPRVTTTGIVAPLVKSSVDFEANYSSYTWKFAARTAGLWANSTETTGIKVVTVDGSMDSSTYDTLNLYNTTKWNTVAAKPATADDVHIAVLDYDNNVLETFLYTSKTSGTKDEQGASKYYVDVINRKSQYVYAGAPGLGSGNTTYTFAGGVSAYPTTGSVIYDSYDLFADTENINIDFVIAGGSLPVSADQISKATKVINIATGRKDCLAFISPHNGFVSLSSTSAQRDAIITFFDQLPSSSYATFDSGYKYVYDRYNDKYRFIPCNADVAGLCVQTSANLEDWFSPAGLNRGNLLNIVKLAYTPTKTDRDKLYQKRINPITSFPGQGTVLFGDKTALATPSAFDRINVRRLFLAVEKRISQLAKGVLFELNDGATRSGFANAANSYLSEIKSKRGVTDYLVVCDETNNTADVIDRNEFVAELYMKPARSINYITVTFVATRSGVSFAEVTGQ
jgi:hypothetical protein